MTEESLEIFRIVAECGSNTEAARILNMSQSSISRALTKLETRYNTKLLNRDSSPFTLTKNGFFLKNRIDRGMSVSQQLARYIEEQKIRKLTIGYAFPVSCKGILDTVLRMKILDPDIRIIFNQYDLVSIQSLMSEGQLDIAVLPDRFFLNDYNIIDSGSECVWGIAAPSGYPLTPRKYVEYDDIIEASVLRPFEGACANTVVEWCRGSHSVHHADSYNSTDTLITLIKSGAGIGFAPMHEQEFLIRHDIRLYVCHPKIITSTYVYMRNDFELSESMQSFLTLYVKHLKQQEDVR